MNKNFEVSNMKVLRVGIINFILALTMVFTMNIAKDTKVSAREANDSIEFIPMSKLVEEMPLRTFNLIEQQPVVSRGAVSRKVSNGFTYNDKLPLPEKHQEYLWNLCKSKGLDYKVALTVMSTESDFRHNIIAYGGKLTTDQPNRNEDYGYFQINQINHKSLSSTLGTANAPLDPYVNMQWGVHMLSELTKSYGNDIESVLSAYNKGVAGYKKYGKAVKYIERYNQKFEYLTSLGV